MIAKDNYFILSTGRRLYANNNLLSITKEDGVFKIYEGYDGDVATDADEYLDEEDKADSSYYIADKEKKEIAEYMINLWREWSK